MKTLMMSWNLLEGAVVPPGPGCFPAHPDSWLGFFFPVVWSVEVAGSAGWAEQQLSAFSHQVGESHRPSFRPGLEGGSSDEEASSGRAAPSLSAIEHRRSAEGQVINPPMTGASSGHAFVFAL